MFFTHLFIYIKRHLTNPCFITAVFIMPLIAAVFVLCYRVSPVNVRVALYGTGDAALSVEERLQKSDRNTEFVLCDSEDELYLAVEKNDVECGYIFGDTFEKAFKTGETSKFKKSIICVKSPSTVLDTVTNEVVFSAISDEYCGIIASNSAKEIGVKSDISSLYQEYITGDAVFKADIQSVGNKKESNNTDTSGIKLVVSGILAVYILLGGVLGASAVIGDVKRNIRRGGYACIFSAVLIMCAVAELIICVLYGFNAYDALVMALYCIAVCGYANVLRALSSRTLLCGMLPVLVIGSVVFSGFLPLLNGIAPAVAQLKWIFPSGWYVYAVENGKNGIITLAGIAAFMNVGGAFIR